MKNLFKKFFFSLGITGFGTGIISLVHGVFFPSALVLSQQRLHPGLQPATSPHFLAIHTIGLVAAGHGDKTAIPHLEEAGQKTVWPASWTLTASLGHLLWIFFSFFMSKSEHLLTHRDTRSLAQDATILLCSGILRITLN